MWWSKWNPISERVEERASERWPELKWEVSKIRKHHPHMNAIICGGKGRAKFAQVQFGGTSKEDGSGARVHLCLWCIVTRLSWHDWNVQSCPSANCLHSTCNLPTGHLHRALYIWSASVCLNGRVGGIHVGADGRKQTGSDSVINTEGWEGWLTGTVLHSIMSSFDISAFWDKMQNAEESWFLITCTMRYVHALAHTIHLTIDVVLYSYCILSKLHSLDLIKCNQLTTNISFRKSR